MSDGSLGQEPSPDALGSARAVERTDTALEAKPAGRREPPRAPRRADANAPNASNGSNASNGGSGAPHDPGTHSVGAAGHGGVIVVERDDTDTAVSTEPDDTNGGGGGGDAGHGAARQVAEQKETVEAVVGIGRRVVVLANLGLTPKSTPPSEQASLGVANALDSWQGPGTVVIAGNLFDLRCGQSETGQERDLAGTADQALSAHSRLTESLKAFAAGPDRRLYCIPGTTDAAIGTDDSVRASVERLGAEVVPAVDLLCETAAGAKRVKVLPGGASGQSDVCERVGEPAQTNELATTPPATEQAPPPAPEMSWQGGMDRLADRTALRRLVTSRTVYRWLGRHAWWLAVPFVLVLVLSLPATTWVFGHVFPTHPGPVKALHRVRDTRLGARLLVAALVALVELIAAGSVLLIVSRRRWSSLGGGRLEGVFGSAAEDGANAKTTPETSLKANPDTNPVANPGTNEPANSEETDANAPEPGSGTTRAGTTGNDAARDVARDLVASGYAGVVSGSTLQAELTHLGTGFFACPGTAGEVVEEYPGRLGLPPVFLAHRQIAWVELETGADLHARLLLARSDIPAADLARTISRTTPGRARHHPGRGRCAPEWGLVAPGSRPFLRRAGGRGGRAVSRRCPIAVAGLLDLVSAVTPPLRSHLNLVREVLPLEATQAAGALVATRRSRTSGPRTWGPPRPAQGVDDLGGAARKHAWCCTSRAVPTSPHGWYRPSCSACCSCSVTSSAVRPTGSRSGRRSSLSSQAPSVSPCLRLWPLSSRW